MLQSKRMSAYLEHWNQRDWTFWIHQFKLAGPKSDMQILGFASSQESVVVAQAAFKCRFQDSLSRTFLRVPFAILKEFFFRTLYRKSCSTDSVGSERLTSSAKTDVLSVKIELGLK